MGAKPCGPVFLLPIACMRRSTSSGLLPLIFAGFHEKLQTQHSGGNLPPRVVSAVPILKACVGVHTALQRFLGQVGTSLAHLLIIVVALFDDDTVYCSFKLWVHSCPNPRCMHLARPHEQTGGGIVYLFYFFQNVSKKERPFISAAHVWVFIQRVWISG